ncbi:hypothetical protein KKG90_09590 [Candidatus Bipolaricaulota bacterium]|nr:hypothetical protein [Candidatus Bipolaricaulota bacterium]
MKRMRGCLCLLLCVLACTGLAYSQGDSEPQPWPFGAPPPPASNISDTGTFADYVRVEGTAELANGTLFSLGGNSSLVLEPFFLNAETHAAVLPTLGIHQLLSAGITLDWFSIRAEADADLVPWFPYAIGAVAEVTPPAWIFGDQPLFRLESRFGASAFRVLGGWVTTASGTLDLQAGLRIGDSETGFDILAGLLAEGKTQLPTGFSAIDMTASLEAKTALPGLSNEAIKARGRARVSGTLLSLSGSIADLRVDWHAEQWNAYIVAGYATLGGFAFEIGARIARIWEL